MFTKLRKLIAYTMRKTSSLIWYRIPQSCSFHGATFSLPFCYGQLPLILMLSAFDPMHPHSSKTHSSSLKKLIAYIVLGTPFPLSNVGYCKVITKDTHLPCFFLPPSWAPYIFTWLYHVTSKFWVLMNGCWFWLN